MAEKKVITSNHGELASTDEKNAYVMGPHISKVYSNYRPVTWEVTIDIKQRDTAPDTDHSTKWEEIKSAITKLANEKSPSRNISKTSAITFITPSATI